MKRIYKKLISMLIIILIFSVAVEAVNTKEDSVKVNTTNNILYQPIIAHKKITELANVNDINKALLIEGLLPWAKDTNEIVLIDAGINYDLIHSSDLPSVYLNNSSFIQVINQLHTT